MTRILVVEDDRRIASALLSSLDRDGYTCVHAPDGPSGLKSLADHEPDLVLLDLMLPGLDGISVCKRIRERSQVPILILTARDEEPDKLLGLETGADDYVTKPFSLPELKARIRALLRRANLVAKVSRPTDAPLVCGQLIIDPARRRVTVAGQEVDFTATEFDLLAFLAAHPGVVFSRSVLLDKIWHYDFAGYERTVDSHVTRIRKKIEAEPAHPEYVLTVHGVGYRFKDLA
ncbi:MAG: response regulator transcription factor [Candidatus Wallbacteria bacterium]|nr:response regulator transcription factor [Candidatus Wallbacteria bacterium]